MFDGSFDGFLSVVYACYYEKLCPVNIQEASQAQLTLGAPARHIETSHNHAARVYSAIREKISQDAAQRVYYAFLSAEDDRFMTIFEYIRLGFVTGHMVDGHLQRDCVRRVHKLAGHVGKESHLLFGFCRFAETKQGVFYCKITPKNNVLSLLVEYFTQRFINQQWIIHDKRRGLAAIYDGRSCAITNVPPNAAIDCADDEEETQELWVTFFNSLTIKQRLNPKLQRQLLPLYFRKNMTEFK